MAKRDQIRQAVVIVDVQVHTDGGVGFVAVAVTGELDLASAPGLGQCLLGLVAVGEPRIVLDLSHLKLCDASSLTMLVQVAAACEKNGGWLRLAGPRGIVAKVFGIVAFDQTVATYSTVAAASRGDEQQRIKPD